MKRIKSKTIPVTIIISVIAVSISSCLVAPNIEYWISELNHAIAEQMENAGLITRDRTIIDPVNEENYSDIKDDLPIESPVDQSTELTENASDLPLKPVGFVNYGTINATVRAATYIPLGTSEPLTSPPSASTVSAAQGTGGDWPNSSRFILVPLGTYTWCIDWEEADQDGDGYFDYYHYYETETTLLDENDSDELEFAEEVAIMAPPSASPIYRGKCGEEDISPKYIWVEVGEGDCVGIDVDSSDGFMPDDSKAMPGITAICWDNVTYLNQTGRVFCTYKSINWEECTGGPNIGKMYTAEEVE